MPIKGQGMSLMNDKYLREREPQKHGFLTVNARL